MELSTTHLRDTTPAPPAISSGSVEVEPSHIHIPRPSRLGQPLPSHHEDHPAELELDLDEAA